MLKDDPSELLRRLSIICLEDALLHPALPLIVWLMAAHAKGYHLGGTMVNACLRITFQLAAMGIRDFLPPAPSAPGHVPRGFAEADQNLPHAESALVKSMMLRAAYGGMQGDVQMLKGFAALWMARFAGEADALPAGQWRGDCAASTAAVAVTATAGVSPRVQSATDTTSQANIDVGAASTPMGSLPGHDGAMTSQRAHTSTPTAAMAGSTPGAVDLQARKQQQHSHGHTPLGAEQQHCRTPVLTQQPTALTPSIPTAAAGSEGVLVTPAGTKAVAESTQALQLHSSAMSPWLAYVRDVYAAIPNSSSLPTQVTIVGPLQRYVWTATVVYRVSLSSSVLWLQPTCWCCPHQQCTLLCAANTPRSPVCMVAGNVYCLDHHHVRCTPMIRDVERRLQQSCMKKSVG